MFGKMLPKEQLILISSGNGPGEPGFRELLWKLLRLLSVRFLGAAHGLRSWLLVRWRALRLPGWAKLACLATLALFLLNADFDYALQLRTDCAPAAYLGHPYVQNAAFELSEFAPAEPESLRELQVRAYVDRYAELAVREMHRTGVPASITLAQAIIESRSGDSRLAKDLNNHFGIKCFSRSCQKGHCKNYTDDHHKDFFRRFGSVEDSYRAHSQVVLHPRYTSLLRGRKDHASWAKALESGGYATGSRYAEKLCSVIARYRLDRFDRLRGEQ
jgi:hypothetical protein